VEWKEIISGAVLVGVLALLSGFFAWRQVLMLRRLRGSHGLSDDESRWRRGQAWRRLAGSGLMLALAALLAWAVLVMGPQAQRLADLGSAGDTPDAHHSCASTSRYGWRLPGAGPTPLSGPRHIWSTRLYSLRQQRKILDDKRTMLEREVSRLRGERNGHT